MSRRRTSQEKPLFEKAGNVTVPIYRTPSKGYEGFTVSWYEGGKRLRKFFAEIEQARCHARLVATKIENQDRQVLKLTPEDSRIYLDAIAKLRPLNITLDAAVREVVSAREIVGDYPLLQALKFWKVQNATAVPEKRVAEVVAELVRGLKQDGASNDHVGEMHRVLGKFAAAFHSNIGEVSPAAINEYLRDLGTSAGTRNVYRRKIVTLFNYARRVGYLQDRTTAATKTAKAKELGKDIQVYSTQNMAKLLENAPENLLPFLVLCGFSGLRAAEAKRIDWAQIDFAQGTVCVSAKTSKTQARRYAPLPENAAAWLRPIARGNGKVVNVGTVNALRRLGLKSGVTMIRNGLRHSFCSYRLAVTNNSNQTALEAGHSTNILFRHYRQLCTPQEAGKWFGIFPAESGSKVVPMLA
jgi:integrase